MGQIVLTLLLAISVVLTPLGVGAQPVERVYAVGLLGIGSPGEDPSATGGNRFSTQCAS